jgi:GNAT superfamily N-acetyltransferase
MTEYKLSIEDTLSSEDRSLIQKGLAAYNITRAGDGQFQRLSIIVRDDAGNIVGGLLGETFWGWLHIEILWIDEPLRCKGYGSKLMAAAEAEAVKRNCSNSLLDTHSFQARPFYERLGYSVFGVLENYPAEHKRFFMQKKLATGPGEGDS